MKKIFSLLLVALLLVGMLPATAIHSHAATVTETMTVKSTEGTMSGTTSISWNSGNLSLTVEKGSSGSAIRTSDTAHFRMYVGNKVTLKCTAGNITKIVMTCDGTSYTASSTGEDGSKGVVSGSTITITPSATSNTYVIPTISKQTRVKTIAVTYEEAAAPSCEHTNTVTQNAKDASCTEEGYTGDMVCSDCGEKVNIGKIIEKLDHPYVAGICSVCGAEEPTGYVLTDLSDISEADTVIFAVNKSGAYYALPHNNGSSSAPTAVAVTVTDGVLTAEDESKLQWNIKKDGNNLTFYPAGTTANALYCTNTNNGVRVGTNANNVFVMDASGYLKNVATSRYVGIYNTQDWRCYTSTTSNIANQTFGFYVLKGDNASEPEAPACTHENTTTTTVDATCTVAGSVTVTCDSCGETISTQEIPVIDHTYVDGFCSCGKAEPVLTYTRYYIAAKRTGGGKVYYMTNALTTTSTKRYTAFATDLTEVPEKITNAEADKVFVLVDDGSGTYKIYAEGIEGEDKYLGWTSGNSGALVSAADAKKVTVVYNQDGSVKISFVDGDGFRKLTLNNTSGNDYFAWYGTEQANVYLIPVSDVCLHENTTTTTVDATCTVAGSETVVCDDCGETVSTNVIDALGHSYNEDVTDPDCVNGGYTTYTCTACGHSYVGNNVDALGHSYNEDVTDPDCVNGGYTTYTCSVCNHSYVGNNVDALGHSYDEVVTAPTAIKEGYTTFTCSVCNDSYVDHIVPAIGIGELKFEGAILELKNDLTMNFAVSKDLFIEDAYTAPYVVFNVGIKTQTVTTYTSYENYYVFACTNISPSQLGDTVTATLYATLNGETLSTSLEYSVAEYCYTTLETTDDALLKTLVVDLLNYGSASQTYVWYKDKTLSNAALTDEQKAYASADSELASVLKTDYATVENASAQWTGAGLVLKTNVCVRFRFVTDNVEGISVKITAAGKEWNITEFEESGVAGQYYVSFTGLTARQMSEEIFATLCRDGVAVSNTVRYSVESYAYAKQNDADARLANLVKAMMRYGKSAAAYLN